MTIEKRVKVLEDKVEKLDVRLTLVEKKVVKELKSIKEGVKSIKRWTIGGIIFIIILFSAIMGAING